MLKVLKGKKSQCKILHLAKIFFKNKDKIKSFLNVTKAGRIYHQRKCTIRNIKSRNKRNPKQKRRSKTVTVCRLHDTIHRESQRCYQKTTRANQ